MNHRSNESAQWSSCCWGHGWQMKSGKRQDTQSLKRGIQGTLCSASKEVRQQETMLLQVLSYRGGWYNYRLLIILTMFNCIKITTYSTFHHLHKGLEISTKQTAYNWCTPTWFLGEIQYNKDSKSEPELWQQEILIRTAESSALSTYLWLQRKEQPALCHCCPRGKSLEQVKPNDFRSAQSKA